MTQRELSRAARYDAVQLSRVESGDAVPRADAMLRIAIALKTPVGALYGLPDGVSLLPDFTPPKSASAGESRSTGEGDPWPVIALMQQQIDEIRKTIEQRLPKPEGSTPTRRQKAQRTA